VICTVSEGIWNSHGSQEEAGKLIEADGAADAGVLVAKDTTTPSSRRAPSGLTARLALILGTSRLRREHAKPS
jgi:hypothetical protein